ncbi:hypothetical protein DSECCO2_645500 [anaerobic digester metagenome]
MLHSQLRSSQIIDQTGIISILIGLATIIELAMLQIPITVIPENDPLPVVSSIGRTGKDYRIIRGAKGI